MKFTWGSNVDEKNLRGYEKCLKSDGSSTYAFYPDLKSISIKAPFAEDRIVKKNKECVRKMVNLLLNLS